MNCPHCNAAFREELSDTISYTCASCGRAVTMAMILRKRMALLEEQVKIATQPMREGGLQTFRDRKFGGIRP